eukprot:415202-Rhodomonas_salina.2
MALTPNHYPEDFKQWVKSVAKSKGLNTETLFNLLDKPTLNKDEQNIIDAWQEKWDEIRKQKTKTERKNAFKAIDFAMIPLTLNYYPDDFKQWVKSVAKSKRLNTETLFNLLDKPTLNKGEQNAIDAWQQKWDKIRKQTTKTKRKNAFKAIDFAKMPHLKYDRQMFNTDFFQSAPAQRLTHLAESLYVNASQMHKLEHAYQLYTKEIEPVYTRRPS